RTGDMALQHVFKVDALGYMKEHPEESVVFDEAMAAFTSMTAMAVAAAYDFSGLRTLVDVGGGNGALLIGLLRANPHLRGVVFEQPAAAKGAEAQIAAAGLGERC